MTGCLNNGYALLRQLNRDYTQRRSGNQFDVEEDMPRYNGMVSTWLFSAERALRSIFPTELEVNEFFHSAPSHSLMSSGVNIHYGSLINRMHDRLDSLTKMLNSGIQRYTDLPIQERLFIEDIDSFAKARDVNPALVASMLLGGFLQRSEDEVQLALEQIMDVSFHKKDWGGEICDLYTANLVVNGARRATAFLLKGPGIGKKVMTIADCGKNGDQIVRLFTAPADLFVVQYVGPISEALISDCQGKITAIRSTGRNANYLVIDGQDTARLLHAYGKL